MKRELNNQRNHTPGKWQERIILVSSAYRFLAFAIAVAQIFLLPSAYYSLTPPYLLLVGVGIYTITRALYPLHGHRSTIFSYSVIAVDLVMCIFLVASTGGLYSPFLLYTLAPVLTAALVCDGKVTFIIAGLSAAYVLGSHLGAPSSLTQLPVLEMSYFLVYVIAVCLAAALPYLTNVNLRQRLQFDDILQERQRLSREIHDGTVQTLSVLRWQVQLLRRRLAQAGIKEDEAKQLEKLAEKAQRDARESLEFLRNYSDKGSFLSHLKDCLQRLKQDANIGFHLDAEPGELHLEALVKLELQHICQEALTNIRRHSGARNVNVKVWLVNSHLEVSIADDGRGFDALGYHGNGDRAKGYGLEVMQERAESVGGRFRVLSVPGQGTEVKVEVPANSWGGKLWPSR